jgi:hypothetical protein
LEAAERVAQALENALDVFTERLGFPRPLSDRHPAGDDGRIDCYLLQLDNLYGYAVMAGVLFEGECEYQGIGYCVLELDLLAEEYWYQAELTAAHELFHLVQYSLRVFAVSWLFESTARRSEQWVYPDTFEPRGIDAWFTTPQL